MKLITRLATAVAAVLLITGTAFAGPQPYKSIIEPEIEPDQWFNEREFNLDIAAVYTVSQTGPLDDSWGGGAGISYFFTRYIGLGVEGYIVDADSFPSHDRRRRGGSDIVGAVNGNLILRLPLDELRLAPYVFGGGGALFNSDTRGQGHVGGGLEYRFTRSVGVFGEGRHVWLENANNYGLFRAGVRFAF
jgi:hypothetical protein